MLVPEGWSGLGRGLLCLAVGDSLKIHGVSLVRQQEMSVQVRMRCETSRTHHRRKHGGLSKPQADPSKF